LREEVLGEAEIGSEAEKAIVAKVAELDHEEETM